MHGLLEIKQKGDQARWEGWTELDFVSGKLGQGMTRDYEVQNQIIYKYSAKETDVSLDAQTLFHSWEPAGHNLSLLTFEEVESLRLPWDYYFMLVLDARKWFNKFQDVRLVVWFDN